MNERKRLNWRCRRGIREMDILFQGFMEKYYDDLSDAEKNTFEQFLCEADLDILAWITGKTISDNPTYQVFIQCLQKINV